jgi:osmoprotectant transport system substrate-binding protein
MIGFIDNPAPVRNERQLMSLHRSLLITAALVTSFMGVAAFGGVASASSKPTITIGSANYEEQEIVANMYGDVLAHAGYPVKVEPPLGTRAIVVPAIEHNQIDLEPDYAASLLGYLHGGTPQAAGDQITTAIAADNKKLSSFGVTVLPASKALDTNVFVVTKATAKKDHLTTLSSLKPYASKLTLGGPPECPTFAGCEPGLKKVYGLKFAGFKATDEAGPISVAALKNNEVQVVELYSSTGQVQSNGFVALTDNKHLEGADYIVPVVRTSVASSTVRAVLAKLDAKLTTSAISKLNIEATTDQDQPAALAKSWLKSQGLT